MPDLKLYTISDLRNWLLHNQKVEGLSEQIIAPTRAWAIVNNPYVKDDNPALAAIFVNNEAVAFTGVFPELINGVRMWWFSTLYCAPQYRGNGYGLIVVGALVDVYGAEYCLDRWGAPETVEIFTYFGLHTEYSLRYRLTEKKISQLSFRGQIARLIQTISKSIDNCLKPALQSFEYKLCYISFIDDMTYSFMKRHRKKDLFMHTIEMLNWELQYPFMQCAPIIQKVNQYNAFSSFCSNYQTYAVQVFVHSELCGFYVLRQSGLQFNVIYLYYDSSYELEVFSSIVEHVRKAKLPVFQTENESLMQFVKKYVYFPKQIIEKVSLSYFVSENAPVVVTENCSFQMGDGDSFI